MRQFTALAVVGFLGLLLYASMFLPPFGDPDAPLHREISPAGSPVAGTYYIRNAEGETDTPNMVTAVLADYRGYDTMGETLVVLTAGLASLAILRRRRG